MLLGAWTGLCLVLLSLPAPAFARNANDFMPGAKALGMGFSYAAIADDPYALWFNPAAMANTPYIQGSGSLARFQSPTGTLTSVAAGYVRPYEPINTATVGAGYHLSRQVRGLDKDEFLVHYSQELKTPAQLPLTKPMRAGANAKIINEEGPGGAHLGLGVDGSVQLRSGFGLTSSAGFRNLTTNTKILPVLSLASAYTHDKWLTVAADLRVRKGLTEFYPGLEAQFLQGLLSARLGRGFQLDGVRQIAFGLGVNFSPVVLDVSATLPTSRLAEGGAYQFSFTYRFGAPSFAGNFVGQAAGQAETLRAQIETLKARKLNAESQAKSADVRREIAEGELGVLERRVRETQEQYRQLQKKRDEANYEADAAAIREDAAQAPPRKPPMVRLPPPPPPRRPAAPTWPRSHKVKEGDTLRSLAREYYGDANLWERIYEANPDKIDRGLPQEKAELVIPDPRR
jgi:hypothetical protein